MTTFHVGLFFFSIVLLALGMYLGWREHQKDNGELP